MFVALSLPLGCAPDPPASGAGTESSSEAATGSAGSATASSGTGDSSESDAASTDDASTSGSTAEAGSETTGSDTSCPEPAPVPRLWLPTADNAMLLGFDTETMLPAAAVRGQGILTVSVSRTGRVAAGQSLYDGVLLVHPDPSACADTNGMPGIQTSTSDDPLPYLEDECVVHLPSDGKRTMSFVAWPPAVFDPDACAWEPERLWVVRYGVTEVRLIDVDSGTDVGEVSIDDTAHVVEAITVDGGGNLWVVDTNFEGRGLTRIEPESLTVTNFGSFLDPILPRFPVVDAEGYLWFSDLQSELARFDPQSGELEHIGDRPLGPSLVPHAFGLLWGGGDGVNAVARASPYDVVDELGLNTSESLVAIDFDERLWVAYQFSGLRRIALDDTTVIDSAASPDVPLTPRGDLTGYAIAHAGER